MKKYLLMMAVLFCGPFSDAQMTLDHAFTMTSSAESEIVNLSLSGRKIMVMNLPPATNVPDTVYFYNMDYSFWKKIICPTIPGYYSEPRQFLFGSGYSGLYLFYPSETLFNTDDLLEIAVLYGKERTDTGVTRVVSGTIFIVNENGTLMDSITNLSFVEPFLQVFETATGVFKATVSTFNGISVYNLPGTIPCSVCGNGMGISKVEKPNILTEPIPNPSSNEVKITFTLPEGAHRGELMLYNSTGQKIKTYQVDDRFGFIMLNNAQLPAGMYYYNIVVNGEVSSVQKMVLVK